MGKNNINMVKLLIINVLVAASVIVPDLSRAQDTNAVAPATSDQTTNAPVKHKKHSSLVFNGKVSAVDTNAMTLTIGKRTFDITSETKIIKDGQPATLNDIAVGDSLGGAYKKSEDGKLSAVTVHDGKKKSGSDDGGK